MIRWLAVTWLVGLAAPALAQQSSANVYRSAYFLGRGDTGIASADDQEAVFYNPAGLANGKGIYKETILASPQVEVSQSTRDLASQLTAKTANTDAQSQEQNQINIIKNNIGKSNHLGENDFSGVILHRVAIGVFESSNVDMLAYDDPNAGGLEAVHAAADATAGATFSLADHVLSDKFSVGVTGKYIERGRAEVDASAADINTLQQKLQDKNSLLGQGTGAGADVGLMYNAGGRTNPSLGITVDDVGGTHVQPTQPTNLDLGLKQTVNIGASITTGTQFSHLKLLADYHDATGAVISDPRLRTHFGTELDVLGTVGVTMGLNQGYPTAGCFLDLHFVRLDFAMYTEEMGDRAGEQPDTRYVFRLRAAL